jgi:hypothetical protein
MTESTNVAAKETDVDLSIAQMLALAQAANVSFDIAGDRLVIRSTRIDWKLWPPVRWYLDEIGIPAITDFFKRTTAEDRAVLSALA